MMGSSQIPFVVKVCGITREQDACCAVAAGANALGFNFYLRSPRYVSFEDAASLATKLPSNVLKVGIFVNTSTAELERAIDCVPLDVVQLHGSVDGIHWTVPAWRAVPASQLQSAAGHFEAYLLDTPSSSYGGSGRTFDWRLAKAIAGPVILAGGLDESNVTEAIETARPWGVDACSRLESKPGQKDERRVQAFVQAAVSALRMAQEITL